GLVRFERFEAVLRDGSIVKSGSRDDVLPERTLDESQLRAESVDVYVGLPRLDPGLPNMDLSVECNEPRNREEGPPGSFLRMVPIGTDAGARRVPRYTTRIAHVSDLAGEAPVPMPVWHHQLRIVLRAEEREAFESVKVAELVRSAAGGLVVRESFVPPALRLGASRFLVTGLRQVLGAMLAKQQALATSRRQRSATMVEFQAADAARFWLLHTLNTFLPSITDVASKPETHPAQAHEKLATLVGALCTFDVAMSPTEVPLYDHLQPGPGFERLFGMALALLERLIAERHVQVPLTPYQGDIHTGALRDPAIYRHEFFFGVGANGGPFTVGQFREHVPRYAKVSSSERILQLVETATQGARLRPVDVPPAALPVKADVAFFRVETTSEYWAEAIARGSVAIHLPIPGVHLALYAVDPQSLQ
ncbi:MAG TPA: type VI secretion system baseplate subunit TssK, partial [Polyangiaceae bacterium]